MAQELRNFARQTALRYGVDPDFMDRLFQQESSYNPQAVSPAGARGIAQMMPGTAARYNVDVTDPYSSIDGATRHILDLLQTYNGDYALAAAAYNAGEDAVNAALQQGGSAWLAYLPEETRRYVPIVAGGGSTMTMSYGGSSDSVTTAYDQLIADTIARIRELDKQIANAPASEALRLQVQRSEEANTLATLSLARSRAAEASTALTPFQQGQLQNQAQQNALAAGRLTFDIQDANAKNQIAYLQQQIALGNLTYNQAMAQLQRWMEAQSAATNEAKFLTEAQLAVAGQAPMPNQEYYAGMEPGGPASVLARSAGLPYDASRYRLGTAEVNPEATLAAARERYGVNGPPPLPVPTRVDVSAPAALTVPNTAALLPQPPTPRPTLPADVQAIVDRFSSPQQLLTDLLTAPPAPAAPQAATQARGGASDPRDVAGYEGPPSTASRPKRSVLDEIRDILNLYALTAQ